MHGTGTAKRDNGSQAATLEKKWLRRVNLHGFSNWIIPGASGPRRGAIVDRGRTRAIVDR